MKDAIKKLTGLINSGFSFVHLAEGEMQLIQVVQEFDTALFQSVYENHPRKTLGDLIQIAVQLAHLIYTICIQSSHPPSHKKIIKKHLTCLYTRLQQYIREYGFENEGFLDAELLPPKDLSGKIQVLFPQLSETGNPHDIVMLLQPHMIALHKLKYPSFHQWLWWCSFQYNAAKRITAGETGFLEDLLIHLDFNTISFKQLLFERFKNCIAGLETISEKTEFLRNEIIKYSLYKSLVQSAYFPGACSVKQYMLAIHKIEIKLMYITAMHSKEPRTALKQSPPFILQTGLSVAHAALLVRLMVQVGIIKSDNHTVLLKHLAAIMSTPHTANVSAGSLHGKFYTPERASKDILKDYLFMMINQLRDL